MVILSNVSIVPNVGVLSIEGILLNRALCQMEYYVEYKHIVECGLTSRMEHYVKHGLMGRMWAYEPNVGLQAESRPIG